MPLIRKRKKQVYVDHMLVVSISAAATLQIGDVKTVLPYAKARAFAGERGAPSFITGGAAPFQQSILHYVNHRDQDDYDLNIVRDVPEPVSKRRASDGKQT